MGKVDDVPEWAIKRAVELAGFPVQVDDENRPLPWRQSLYNAGLDAFARYIAAHEPAPVDPLREVVADVVNNQDLANDSDEFIDLMLRHLRARLPGIDALARGVTLEPTREGERGEG